jgi:hypothetical protein
MPNTFNEIAVVRTGEKVKDLFGESHSHFYNQLASLVTGRFIAKVISSSGYVAVTFCRSSQTSDALIERALLKLMES